MTEAPDEGGDRRVIGENGAEGGGNSGDLKREPGVVGDGVEVTVGGGQAGPSQARVMDVDVPIAQPPVAGGVAKPGDNVVEGEAGAIFQAFPSAVVDREDEGNRTHETGGQAQQQAAFGAGLTDEPELAVAKIAEAAVDEFGGAAAGAGGEIAGFDESGSQAAGGGVEGDAAAGDAAADHEQIELPRAELGDAVRARSQEKLALPLAKRRWRFLHASALSGANGRDGRGYGCGEGPSVDFPHVPESLGEW